MDINNVTISGRLTRDPEIRYTQAGKAVCNFSMAYNEKWKDRESGELREKTTFVDIKAWGKTAEFVSTDLTKGCGVLVSGKLEQEQWDDKETGKKRSKMVVQANAFLKIESRRQPSGADNSKKGPSGRTNNLPETDEAPGSDETIPF